jgi:hypothetical protein
MKLRACYRVPLEQFTPKQWSFGLHNRDVLHARQSEDLKIALATACELGPWKEFCELVVDNPGGILKAYGLDHGEPMFNKKEVQYLLTLDALTIFFVFVAYARPRTHVENIRNVVGLIRNRMSWGYAQVPIDLFLFENQIPIFLLQNFITQCYRKWRVQETPGFLKAIVKANVLKMCKYIFKLTGDLPAKFHEAYPEDQLEQCTHIVACVHRILCGANFTRISQETTIILQSATSFKKAGIQIKGIKGLLVKVEFRKRCLLKPILFLPIVKLYDQTESYFRNLAMYEYYNTLGCPFGEYLQLMTDLIREEGDVKHLIDCGVIQNRLATDKNAFQMWSNLQSELFLPKYSEAYEKMVSKINKQCKSSLNVMTTDFYQLFCSRPWYVFGLFTATIVTVGTFLGAYTSVIGSHKMKPSYPPS